MQPFKEESKKINLSLNALTDDMVNKARAYKSIPKAVAYIRSIVHPNSYQYVKSFVQDVIFGEEKQQFWYKGSVLIPDVSLSDLLIKNDTEILSFMLNFSVYVMPDIEDWRSSVASTGSPAIVQPETDYLTSLPQGFISINKPNLLPVYDKDIIYTRWIAQRLGRYLSFLGIDQIDLKQDFNGLPETSAWNEKSKIALQALVEEKKITESNSNLIPGYIGGDHLYRSI